MIATESVSFAKELLQLYPPSDRSRKLISKNYNRFVNLIDFIVQVDKIIDSSESRNVMLDKILSLSVYKFSDFEHYKSHNYPRSSYLINHLPFFPTATVNAKSRKDQRSDMYFVLFQIFKNCAVIALNIEFELEIDLSQIIYFDGYFERVILNNGPTSLHPELGMSKIHQRNVKMVDVIKERKRKLQTLQNVVSSLSGAGGWFGGGDLWSDIGVFLGQIASARAKMAGAKSKHSSYHETLFDSNKRSTKYKGVDDRLW